MKIASRMENIKMVNEILRRLKQEYRIEENKFFCMLTSVNEAITNAIRHGNEGDPSKKVIFDYRRSPAGTLIFTITDEGKGFNWHQAGQGFSGKADREGGRGLIIMKRLSDKHLFNKKGNTVELHFIL